MRLSLFLLTRSKHAACVLFRDFSAQNCKVEDLQSGTLSDANGLQVCWAAAGPPGGMACAHCWMAIAFAIDPECGTP